MKTLTIRHLFLVFCLLFSTSVYAHAEEDSFFLNLEELLSEVLQTDRSLEFVEHFDSSDTTSRTMYKGSFCAEYSSEVRFENNSNPSIIVTLCIDNTHKDSISIDGYTKLSPSS